MIRELLTSITGVDASQLPADTKLFGPALRLDSLAGAELLARIEDQLGVDVASEDLALECLDTIETLERFIESGL